MTPTREAEKETGLVIRNAGRSPRRSRPTGLTVMEVVLGALIVGCAAIPVLELIRSSTVALEITEIETAARGLGADVLESIAEADASPRSPLPGTGDSMMGVERRWDEVVDESPSLRKAFPKSDLSSLFDTAEVKVAVTKESPCAHPAVAGGPGLDWYEVTVSWRGHDGQRKGVTLGRLVEP